jgi:hypothetical protein
MKLESSQSAEVKARWKVVRRDDCTDVLLDCPIIQADEADGECEFEVKKPDGSGVENRKLSFGNYGIRIVPRGKS